MPTRYNPLKKNIIDLLTEEKSDVIFVDLGIDFDKGGSVTHYNFGTEGNDNMWSADGVNWHFGGKGDDNYHIKDEDDVAVEHADEGSDDVYSSVNYTLGDNLENLILQGDAFLGIGNELDNIIQGTKGDNALWGMDGDDKLSGMEGKDEMHGGDGDDTYQVENTGDIVIEHPGEGKDTVNTWVTYTMPDDVEVLTMQGSDAIDATGNNQDNWIYGNPNDNKLSGLGGDDWLIGGPGNDTIDGGAGKDSIIAGPGGDTMTGGTEEDTFWFDGDVGNDVITDFKANGENDIIGIKSNLLVDFGDLLASAQQNGSDVVIDFGGGHSLTLQNFDVANLSASDFLFY